jgi:tricorn protease
MRKTLLTFLSFAGAFSVSQAQVNAALFRYPDVSATQIVFTYANDLWTVPKTGGQAIHLSSPSGVEAFPQVLPRWGHHRLYCRL